MKIRQKKIFQNGEVKTLHNTTIETRVDIKK